MGDRAQPAHQQQDRPSNAPLTILSSNPGIVSLPGHVTAASVASAKPIGTPPSTLVTAMSPRMRSGVRVNSSMVVGLRLR